MVHKLAKNTEHISTRGTIAELAILVYRDWVLTGGAGAVHDIHHLVQACHQQHSVILCEDLLSDQLLYLKTGQGYNIPAVQEMKMP